MKQIRNCRSPFQNKSQNPNSALVPGLLLSIFMMIVSSNAFGINYYVSPSGNNNYTGIINMPFKTISKGISKLKPGDILYVRGGVYNENVSVYGVNGTENGPIIITAYPGESPIIDGNGISISNGSALVIIWQSYVQFRGFEVRNSNQSGIVCGKDANHCIISSNVVHNVVQSGIGYYGDYGIVEHCTVYDACLSNNDGIYTPPETWGAGINIRNHPVARHNIVHDVWGEGLSMTKANDGIVEDNIVYDVCNVLLYIMNCQNCLIQRNLVYMTKNVGNASPVGIGHWNEQDANPNLKNLIINNIAYRCKRNFYNASAANGTIVANNSFVNSTYLFNVQISGANPLTGFFENNIIIQEDALPCISAASDANITFRNNIYNKSFSNTAAGAGTIVSDPDLSRSGDTGAGKLTAEFFRPNASSPAINKGTNVTEVKDDIFGNKRDSKPDIGAIEYFTMDPEIKVNSIDIVPANNSAIMTMGATMQLNADILPENASKKSIFWELSDGTEHGTINSAGLLKAFTAGKVTVKASAEDGSGVSDTINIRIDPDTENTVHMMIYPNPATSHFIISLLPTTPLPLSLTIFNLSGSVLLHEIIYETSKEMNVSSSFANGTYFIQLLSEKKVYETQKLIVNR
jgi:hypothetical protein